MSSSGFEYTYIIFFHNCSEHDCFLQTRRTASQNLNDFSHFFDSPIVLPESLLQCHQYLDHTFTFLQRLERFSYHRTQHANAVRPLHRVSGRG